MGLGESSCASSIKVFSPPPLTAAKATFALKFGLWFQRGLLLMVFSSLRGNHAAVAPKVRLSTLFRFPEPPLGKLSDHAVTGNRGVRDSGQALMGDVIDHVQDPEPPTVGHLDMHEVQRPPGIRPCLHEDRHPDANGPLAALALAHAQPFLPIEPVDAVDARGLALPPQQDEQPAVAEPPALVGKVTQPLPEPRASEPGPTSSPRLLLPQDAYDLFFREPLPHHLPSPSPGPDSKSIWRKSSVAGHPQLAQTVRVHVQKSGQKNLSASGTLRSIKFRD